MRVKFEATDATGKVHKRGSRSRIYSHCVVILTSAAHRPNKVMAHGCRRPTAIAVVGGKPCAGQCN